MTFFILLACIAGVLVGLSRQLNGRLSVHTSPLAASFWNHLVGFGVLSVVGLLIGGLLPLSASDVPLYAYLGGPIGVVFVAAGSWAIARIGAINTALLIISGQMVSGVVLDLFRSAAPALWASSIGVVLILGGLTIVQFRVKGNERSQKS